MFSPPYRLEGSTDITHTAIKIAALSDRLSLEDRTLVNHRDGHPENVAEHSHMLSLVAPILAERYYPNLDANLVARFSTIHDVVEAYVGDTPTHDINAEGMTSKEEREEQGLKQLLIDYHDEPTFVKLVADYEEQQVPEARFVRAVDKLMPGLVHILEGGITLRGHIDIPGLLENSAQRAEKLREEFPEFQRIVEAREELTTLFT